MVDWNNLINSTVTRVIVWSLGYGYQGNRTGIKRVSKKKLDQYPRQVLDKPGCDGYVERREEVVKINGCVSAGSGGRVPG